MATLSLMHQALLLRMRYVFTYACHINSNTMHLTQAMVYARPKRIAITGGYHGAHKSLEVYQLSKEKDFEVIGIDDEFKEGDLCWLETPLNPTGEARRDLRCVRPFILSC